jgi:DNA-directed RNA polymerase subunit M/transcription elongation factor TFIIS
MNNFCSSCENLLTSVTTAESMHFRCVKCGTQAPPDPKGTLLYENTKGANLMAYSSILQTAGQDPVCPKVYRKCKSCNNNLVRQVRLGKDMSLINVCIKCSTPWLESTTDDDKKENN